MKQINFYYEGVNKNEYFQSGNLKCSSEQELKERLEIRGIELKYWIVAKSNFIEETYMILPIAMTIFLGMVLGAAIAISVFVKAG